MLHEIAFYAGSKGRREGEMMVFTMREPGQWWIVETGEQRERREREDQGWRQ